MARPEHNDRSSESPHSSLDRIAVSASLRLRHVGRSTTSLSSSLLAAIVTPWFLLLTAFVGLNQWLYVVVGACPASLVLEHFFGIDRRCRP